MSETHIEELDSVQPTEQTSESSEMSSATTSAQVGSPPVESIAETEPKTEPTIIENKDEENTEQANNSKVTSDKETSSEDKTNDVNTVKAELAPRTPDEVDIKDYTHNVEADEEAAVTISKIDLIEKETAESEIDLSEAKKDVERVLGESDDGDSKVTEAVLDEKDIKGASHLSDKAEPDSDKKVDEGKNVQPTGETCEVSSSTSKQSGKTFSGARSNDHGPSHRRSSSSRRPSYNSGRNSIGGGGGFQNYGLTYLPYKSNFEPSEDARRRADEFFKTLKL